MGGRNNAEVQMFDPFCPKAIAGLNERPPTIAHRSINIGMQPPLPDDRYEDDYDIDVVEAEAEPIRARFQAWADSQPPLQDPGRRPKKLPGLDGRTNENWRGLFRIADLAGGRWPQAAREAALALSTSAHADDEKSMGLRLLSDIRDVFIEERLFIATLCEYLNALESSPWGGFSDGKGITTRELGKKLRRYETAPKAHTIHIGEKKANGYARHDFEDVFKRYLPAHSASKSVRTVQSHYSSQKAAKDKPCENPDGTVSKNPANAHEQWDGTVGTVSNPIYEGGGDKGRFCDHCQTQNECAETGSCRWVEAELERMRGKRDT